MNEGSLTNPRSANDSMESGRSLCELSSHDFAGIKETITFVDKTLFIKSFFGDGYKIVLLTAPKGFGKSTLMDMLKQFLLGNTELFKDLKICTEEKRFFSKRCVFHPVIHIDLGNVRGSSFANVKHNLALAVYNAFQEHKHLVKETDDGVLIWTSEKLKDADMEVEIFESYYRQKKCVKLNDTYLETSLQFLSEVLHVHYEKKVFILIDEYDAPAVGMVFEESLKKDCINSVDYLLRSFMACTLKFNRFVERTLIFARVGLARAFSGNATRFIKYRPFLSDPRYARYFGFTSEEVEELLQRPQLKNICWDLKTIRKWYGGYIVSDSSEKIYNSWSVLNHLLNSIDSNKPEFSSYWIDTAHVKNIKLLFTNSLIRREIEEVIPVGSEIKIRKVRTVSLEDIKSLNELIHLKFVELSWEAVDLFLQFLADSGYFNVLKVDKEQQQVDEEDNELETIIIDNFCSILRVPSFEIRDYLMKVCYSETQNTVDKNTV